ncbi:MAG TPA: MarR family transcriptional regulator [Euzebyales bacterium]
MDVLVNTDATNARTAAATDVLDCLLRAATRVAARQSGQLRDLGLSPSAFALLRHLAAADDGLQPCALADLLAVTRPSVCGLIDGLQAKGLVCREPHDHDGRRVIVRLTRAGAALQSRHGAAFETSQRALLSDLSATEQRELARLVDRVGA